KKRKVLDADAYLIQKQQEAAAIAAEKSAEAEGIIKMRQAMASSGGDTAVLMKYVENFKPEKIVVLPCESGGNGLTVNRLDLNQLISSEAVK
ncbi:MAG: prohibitin family protein, partial [Nanoarchaeota archaeon]